MVKLAIIGASELQLPLIERAKALGHTTHVFAWAAPGTPDVGELAADVFHAISITEVDAILRVCQKEHIDGICTIASDLATVAVGHVAAAMGLSANPPEVVARCTNKHLMRRAFEAAGCPSPKSICIKQSDDAIAAVDAAGMHTPLIVKPADRSGSRGITKLEAIDPNALASAITAARAASFAGEVLVEEYAHGCEFSVEGISWQGKHTILAITEKFTTGAPHFIERGHLEPARLDDVTAARVREVAVAALNALGVVCGASHTELKVAPDGTIRLIEVGARMGGDFIGSHLVQLSCGYDYLQAVIDVALGIAPAAAPAQPTNRAAAVRYIFGQEDVDALEALRANHPEYLVSATPIAPFTHQVTDSSTRFGSFIMAAPSAECLAPYLPHDEDAE